MPSMSPLARVKSFISDLFLWSFFVVGLAASMGGAGAVLDGTAKTVATFGGIAVSLFTGSKITKKPKIKAFMSSRPVLWFLFLFNAGVAAISYFTMDGAKGIATAAGMGLVSLGAAGGLVSNYRNAGRATPQEPVHEAPYQQFGHEAEAQYPQPVHAGPYQEPAYPGPYRQPAYGDPTQYRQPYRGTANRPGDDTHWV
ncbi:hypothetical protein ACQEWB_20965 [Streptomyces sp. CA-249302]|uniref:hypothetical protein n=1 Tax=Streptomyces sp. CA-249302 TaxID=3240058 RepID=UPI003D8FA91D